MHLNKRASVILCPASPIKRCLLLIKSFNFINIYAINHDKFKVQIKASNLQSCGILVDANNILFENPRNKLIEKVFGPLSNFLLEYHISPLIIGLLILLILCIKYFPSLKGKDGNYNDYVVMLIAVTIIGFIAFIYTQVNLIIEAIK